MFVKDGEMVKVLVDTGATSHFVNDKSKFVDFDEDFNANVHVIKAKVNAKVKPYEVNHRSNGNALDVMLNSALYVPTYQQSIFSVHAAVKRGASVSLGKDVKQLHYPGGSTFEIKQKDTRLYYLPSISSSKDTACSLNECHKIMSHCNYGHLLKLEGAVESMRVTNYEEIECILCTEGKMCQIRNKSPDEKAKAPLDFVHCDLAGRIDPTGRDGFKYALSFVDDFSGLS